MTGRLIIILLIAISITNLIYSQDEERGSDKSPLERFRHEEEHFRTYLIRRLRYPDDAVENGVKGVLLTGMILDNSGKIKKVFNLNSLSPSIDENAIKIFELSDGFWKPKIDSNSKNDIIIVPIVYVNHLIDVDCNIDRDNFKHYVAEEVFVTIGYKPPIKSIKTQNTKRLLKEYNKLTEKSDYSQAYPILVELLKREPLNVDYYIKMIQLEVLMGNNDNACQNLKFIISNFKVIPDIGKLNELDCK